MSALLRLRRGVGAIYALSGALHCILVALHGPLPLSARLWSQLYFGHFLLLIVGGALFLTVNYFRSGLFTVEPLVNFIVGIPVFMILLTLAAGWVIHGGASALAFIPGAFLLAYGFRLRRGRAT